MKSKVLFFIFTPPLQNIMFQRELLGVHCSEILFFLFDSVSLDFLALWPRLPSCVLGGVTPGEEMKQQHTRVREFMSEWASESVVINVCGVPPSLVEVQEEEELVSEAGEVMRRGDGKGRGEKGGAGAHICDQRVRPLVGSWRRGEEQEEKLTEAKTNNWSSPNSAFF